jgi:DNA replication and repair protein RecF
LLRSLGVLEFRGYPTLEVAFGPGPQLVVGPNAAGKTSLLEAIVLLAWGRSHRTSADGELIRWGADLARVEGTAGGDTIEVAIARSGTGMASSAPDASAGTDGLRATTSAGSARKRIRVNGVPRRASSLLGIIRTVLFAPEEMLLVAGSPALRRTALDQLAAQRSPLYLRELSTYSRALQQRNGLLRAIREEQASRDELRYWDSPLLDAGAAIVDARLRLLTELAEPLAAAHAEIAPQEAEAGRLGVRYMTNAPALPGERPRDALARRLAETAEKEVWNGSTLIGPHRDDVVFELAGRDLATFASRGQQRTAILAWKLAELDLLTAHDRRPPLLLLDDVFSELDPERRSHLVRRIAELPQAFVTTTTPADLDRELVAAATTWEVRLDARGATLTRTARPVGAGR